MSPLFKLVWPDLKSVLLCLTRAALLAFGVYLVHKGYLTNDQGVQVGGWLYGLVSVAFTVFDKFVVAAKVNNALHSAPPGFKLDSIANPEPVTPVNPVPNVEPKVVTVYVPAAPVTMQPIREPGDEPAPLSLKGNW
jgi:hypothetical protein